jgi:hypothetical protein
LPILLLTVSVAQAADPGDEGEGGGATASAADMPQICKDQAAKRNLTGAEADEYLKKCAAAPAGDAERSAAPDERQEGQL